MILGAEHRIFQPLWARILIVAVCMAWSGLEWIGGGVVWPLVATAATTYVGWLVLLRGSGTERGTKAKG